jgi:charged multivesicular body protein 7
LRALSAASKKGLIPSQAGANSDRFLLRTGEELSRSLQTQEFGRPLALGAVLQDAVERKELVPLAEFLNAKKSIYAKTWIPTPWQAVSWGLKQLGVMGGESVEDQLVAGNFVVMANVEVRRNDTVHHAAILTFSRPPRKLYWTRLQG